MMPVRLEPATPRSRVKHSTTAVPYSRLKLSNKKNVCASRLNSVDPDEMSHVLHCLLKCAYRSHWYTKGLVGGFYCVY